MSCTTAMAVFAFVVGVLLAASGCGPAPENDPNEPVLQEWCRENGEQATTTTDVAP